MAQAIPISKSRVANVVFNLDLIALLSGVLIIWKTRSGAAALLTAGLATFCFGNFGRIGGNFLQYFWFPLVIITIVLWRRNRPGYSGAVLGIAVGLQTFPLFFGLPILARGVIGALRGHKEAEWLPHYKFGGALIAVIVASFLSGSLAGRGVGGWSEWQKKISIHKNYLQGEIFDIGLANLTAVTVSTNRNSAATYIDDVASTFMRLDSLKRNMWIYYALSTLFLAMWFLIVVRAPACDLFGHGFLLLFTAVNLSPYYYLSLALVPFMFWNAGRILRLYAVCGTVVLFTANGLLFRGESASFVYLPHLVSGWSIAIFLLGLGAISVFSYRHAALGTPQRKSSYFINRVALDDASVHDTSR